MDDRSRDLVGLDCGATHGNRAGAGAIVPDKTANEVSDSVPKIRTRRCYNFIYKKSWYRRTYAPSFRI
jgi:hypothetical protein